MPRGRYVGYYYVGIMPDGRRYWCATEAEYLEEYWAARDKKRK